MNSQQTDVNTNMGSSKIVSIDASATEATEKTRETEKITETETEKTQGE